MTRALSGDRVMNANAQKRQAPDASPAHDAWGVIDPRQADVPAALQTFRDEQPLTLPPPETQRLEGTSMCSYCCETLMPADRYCSRCLRPVAKPAAQAPARADAPVIGTDAPDAAGVAAHPSPRA